MINSVVNKHSCTVLADIRWTLLRGGIGNHKGTRKASRYFGIDSILGTVRIIHSNLCEVRFLTEAISTAKIKHCYGFIAGALSIVGNAYLSGREKVTEV